MAFSDRASTAESTDRSDARRKHFADAAAAGHPKMTDVDGGSWYKPPFMIRPMGVPELPFSKMRFGPNKQRRLLSSAQSAREIRKLPAAHSELDEQSSGFDKWPAGQKNDYKAAPPSALKGVSSMRRLDSAPEWNGATHRGKQRDKPKLLVALDAFIGQTPPTHCRHII